MTIDIRDTQYHRNGICGEGFHVVTFDWHDDGETKRMVAIRFSDNHGSGGVCCAVLDIDLLAKGDIRFGSNSWRGDHFVDEVDQAINEQLEAMQ